MMENSKIIIVNEQVHIGGVILQSKLASFAPPSCPHDVEKQRQKSAADGGNSAVSNGSPGGNTSGGGQNELVQKIADFCKVPTSIAKQALDMSKGNPQEAVTLINNRKKEQA